MNGQKDIFCWCLAVFFVVVIVGLGLTDGESSRVYVQTDVNDATVDRSNSLRFDFSVDFPADTTIISDAPNGKGWRQVGTFRVDIDTAEEVVDDLMAQRGFVRRQAVGDEMSRTLKEGHGGVRHLVQYETPTNEKVMWMLWESGVRKTGFAWGSVR